MRTIRTHRQPTYRRPVGRAFTLVEMVVVAVVVALLLAVALVAHSSTMRESSDRAGFLVLSGAQVEGRRVLAQNPGAQVTQASADQLAAAVPGYTTGAVQDFDEVSVWSSTEDQMMVFTLRVGPRCLVLADDVAGDQTFQGVDPDAVSCRASDAADALGSPAQWTSLGSTVDLG